MAPRSFAWQAWRFRHLTLDLRGRRGAFCTTIEVQFFDISTSKSGPELTCFVHFHLKMCFSPQRRAIFQHLNFKKWSDNVVFCTFSLDDALLATAPCNF